MSSILIFWNCLSFSENDLDPSSNPFWSFLGIFELQQIELIENQENGNVEMIPEIQLKILDSSLSESEQNTSFQFAFRKRIPMDIPDNVPVFDLDNHFYSYSQLFSSDSILRLQGLGKHAFDIYTVEDSETIKIGALEFNLEYNSSKENLNYEFQPASGLERFVVNVQNVKFESRSMNEFHYGTGLISYFDGNSFFGAFSVLEENFQIEEYSGKHYIMKSEDGLNFRIAEENTQFGIGYKKKSTDGKYDFSDGTLLLLQSDHNSNNTYRLVRGVGSYLGSNGIIEMEEVANFTFDMDRRFLNQNNLEVEGFQLGERKLIIAHTREADGFLPFKTHVFVSQDEVNWQELVIPELDGNINESYIPFLGIRPILQGDTLHIYYVINSGPPVYKRISTQDGIHWSAPQQVRFFNQ